MTGRTWPPAADRGLARKRPVNAPFHRCHDRFLDRVVTSKISQLNFSA